MGSPIITAVASIIMVAFVLLIGVMVLGGFWGQGMEQDTWEELVVNETIDFVANGTDYTFACGPVVRVGVFYHYPNLSTSYVWPTVTNCGTIGYILNADNSSISACVNGTTNYPNLTTGEHYLRYVCYNGTGYGTMEGIGTQTFSGFRLGSLIPFLLFAVLIIGVIIAGFSLSR